MDRFLHSRLPVMLRKYAVSCLACSWILGLFFGLWAVRYTAFDPSVLRASFLNYTPISIISVALLPVLISVLAVFTEQSWLVLVVGFLKAFGFSYVSYLVTSGYGAAGWLIQFLVMFSDCLSLPFLWWFWCVLLKSERLCGSLLFPAAIAATAIGILDFRVISPFLSTLQILQKG